VSQYAEPVSMIAMSRLAVLLFAAFALACTPSYKPGLPPGSPFADQSTLAFPQSAATGDVSDHDAWLWFRTNAEEDVRVSWNPDGRIDAASTTVHTSRAQDFTATVHLDGLSPATRYRYRVEVVRGAPTGVDGQFTTAPAPNASTNEVFLWSADIGGQQRCRRDQAGYPIFDVMLKSEPAFVLLLGDLIYSDDRCPSPPNAPGADFVATRLDEYRAKHRYQHEDAALQRLLSAVPVSVMWDDHEVRNNFAGPVEPLMPAGRQALFEFWPIARTGEPTRLYRTIRRGANLQVFILDTRQYRHPNSEKDGPQKSMLGPAQRAWLLEELRRSTATWKVVASSVPLANPKGGTLQLPGNDSWAMGNDGTGFHHELRSIIDALREHRIQNVVWLAGDVHYAQVATFDPDGDGEIDFYEAVAGPLSAAPAKPLPQQPALHPSTLYAEGGFLNFGRATVTPESLRLEIVDEQGVVRFTHTIQPRVGKP